MAYIFDPDLLQDMCRQNLDLPLQQKLEAITDALDKRCPGRIPARRRWIFKVAGGAMGMLTILYGSMSEYLIFFGSPIPAGGYSGRYWVDIYDIVLTGEMRCYTQGQFEPSIYNPGDMAYLRRGTDKGYRVKSQTWMLEYARGFIPQMLPFGALCSTVTTLDFRSMRQQFWDYGRILMKEILKGKI